MNPLPKLPRTVWILGAVSFFTDVSSEMIYPLLPLFLAETLGAGALQLGIIEGVAEATSSVFKFLSGRWTDRTRRRKPWIVAGYGIAGLVRPLIGLAGSWPQVLSLRFADRVGKGLRTSPRDALIADATSEDSRGRAYGLHRSMDHAGAVIGPLVAAALLHSLGVSLRMVFLAAAVPALIAWLVLVFGIREGTREGIREGVREEAREEAALPEFLADWKSIGPEFKTLLLALLVFTLGNSTDAFLLLRMADAGVPASWVAGLWALHHLIKMAATYLGGILSDRFSRKNLIRAGWMLYAAVYLGFALATSAEAVVALFLCYGIFHGLTEPSERAWVSELVPERLRGTAFGLFHFTVGLGALPASLLFGYVWQSQGAPVAFLMGATLAWTAAGLLFLIRQKRSLKSDA